MNSVDVSPIKPTGMSDAVGWDVGAGGYSSPPLFERAPLFSSDELSPHVPIMPAGSAFGWDTGRGDASTGVMGLAHLSYNSGDFCAAVSPSPQQKCSGSNDRMRHILPSFLSSDCSDDVEGANPKYILLAEKLTVAFTEDAKPGQKEMMASRSRFNGKVKLGCRHCYLKNKVLPKGAQSAPESLGQIYRHLGRTLSKHIAVCVHVPAEERAELKALAKRRKKGTEQYLTDAAARKGYSNLPKKGGNGEDGGGIAYGGKVGEATK